MHLGHDAAFWTSKPLSSVTIQESLVGDLEERLLQFLADPRGEWEALQPEDIAQEFCSQVTARYADAAHLTADPEG